MQDDRRQRVAFGKQALRIANLTSNQFRAPYAIFWTLLTGILDGTGDRCRPNTWSGAAPLIRGIVVDQGVVCASITEATQLLPGMQDVRVPLGPRGPAVQPSHDKGLITIPFPVTLDCD